MRATRAACLALLLVRGHAHPMHTAVAELTQLDARGATSVQLRLFADDFEAAVPPAADRAAADSATANAGHEAVVLRQDGGGAEEEEVIRANFRDLENGDLSQNIALRDGEDSSLFVQALLGTKRVPEPNG